MKADEAFAGRLRNTRISEGLEDYREMVNAVSPENARDIFELIVRNGDSGDASRTVLYDFVFKLGTCEAQCPGIFVSILPAILNAVKNMENTAPVLFLALEHLKGRKDETLRLRTLEIIGKTKFTTASIIDLLYRPECGDLVADVLCSYETYVDDFIRTSIKIKNPVVIKNLSLIFPRLPARHFVNYNSFMFLFEDENYCFRCCFLEVIENLIVSFKEQGNLESIKELTMLVSERLNDVNFYVRGKALGCISNLFRRECILKDQRNFLIEEIIDRVRDKTVIVRKKSINILSQILLNQPFKNRGDLRRDGDVGDKSFEAAGDDPGNSLKLEDDFQKFAILMEAALSAVTKLLEYNLKTDIVETSTFIKIAYLLRVRGSEEAIHKILRLVFTKDRDVIIDVFREIVAKREEAIYEFINDKAFDVILKALDIDEKTLYKNFYGRHMVLESIYVLRQLSRGIPEADGLTLLTHATEILFASKDETELKRNIAVYRHTLDILKRLKRRIPHNSDVLKLVNKNIIKMIFFEKSLIKHTVELFYAVSHNPEKNCGKLLKNLCLCQSTLKILDCIGWVAINQYYLLERLERSFKGQGAGRDIRFENMDNEELASFKKSLGSGGLSDLRERRKSLEETRRLSLGKSYGGFKISLKFDELQETMKNKTDEEIADFFFFLKETEILSSESSMLHQFVPLLKASLSSPNEEIQVAAYSTLNCLMLTSSIFFSAHIETFRESLGHPSPTVKNNAVIALHDFIIFYNSAIDPSVLFDYLDDRSISKNVILVVYALLHKNVIRIKNNAVKVIAFLFDGEIGGIVRSIVKSVSANNNTMSVVFYETFLSELPIESLQYLCDFVGSSIQESLFLKCLTSGAAQNRIKCVFDRFVLSEKFVAEHMFRDEMKLLVENGVV